MQTPKHMIDKRRIRIVLLANLLLLFFTIGQGRSFQYEHIDQHARNAPTRVTDDVQELAAYLAEPAKNDLEKVRSFYVWIAENIAYDVRTFRNYRPTRYHRIAPDDVLKSREAVCQGYAELLQAMCQLHNIPCRLVPGYSKGLDGNRRDFTQADHAWNAVKIDDKWQLIDVTWGSGGLNSSLKFVKQFNDEYFLTPPDKFVQDHLPMDPIWQLTTCPVSISLFAEGKEAIQAHNASCNAAYTPIDEPEQLDSEDYDLLSAQRAYRFNPANPLVLVRAYMKKAHHLMNSIPKQLQGRDTIEKALGTQEEALVYLEKAEGVLQKVKTDEALQERKLLRKNMATSRSNLEGLRKVLQ